MSPQVLVVGSANLDLVFRTDRLPKPGETILGGDFSTHPGGKGANQAVAVGRLGGRVSFVGCVGNDVYGQQLKDSLAGANVSTEFLASVDGTPTGTAVILVDAQGMNSIVVAQGANGLVSREQVKAAAGGTVALCQLEIPLDTVLATSEASMFILNPAPARELPDELYAKCNVLTPNETEVELLTGVSAVTEDNCLKASLLLLNKGVENVIVTRGKLGCYWVSRSGGVNVAAPAVQAIDTTAAGDAFNGALALFLAEGREMVNAIGLANCVGALSTTKRGAQESMPSLDELKALAGSLY